MASRAARPLVGAARAQRESSRYGGAVHGNDFGVVAGDGPKPVGAS